MSHATAAEKVVLAIRQMTIQFVGTARVHDSTNVLYQACIDGPDSGTYVARRLGRWLGQETFRGTAVRSRMMCEIAAAVTRGMRERRVEPPGAPPTPVR
jgi:hypothetical protein